MTNKINAMGVYVLSNTAALLVVDVDDYMEEVHVITVTTDQDEVKSTEKCPFTTQENDDGEEVDGFLWGEMFIPFSEVLRIS